MKEILKYELSAFPLSLSTCDGSLTKTVESKLFQAIQDQIKVLSAPMRNTPSIFDDMVLLQKIFIYLENIWCSVRLSPHQEFEGIFQSSLLCHRKVPPKLNQTDGKELTKNK